jgi:hypothetical protein
MPSCQHAEEQQQHLLVPDFAGNQVVFGTAWYGAQVGGWHSEPSLGTAALLFLAIQPMSSNPIHYQTTHLGHAEALQIRLNHNIYTLWFSSFEASQNMMWCYSSERKTHHWKDDTTHDDNSTSKPYVITGEIWLLTEFTKMLLKDSAI